MTKFYITTAIPYVNARPHIGHAIEFVEADVIARYRKMRGDDVFLTTGTDENSLTNVLAAEKAGVDVGEFCALNSGAFRKLADSIGLSYDSFVRTAIDNDHAKVAALLWGRCSKSGDIYRKVYSGLYCVRCELYYTDNELVEGLCPEHRTKPELVEEDNYFFRLSAYQDRLLGLIESDRLKVVPESKKNEVISFVKAGLDDFSVSRSVDRAHGWGIAVPADSSQIMYVWFDALGTYLTGAGLPSDMERFRKLWPADMHVIGKGILRFHAVYWPAMLLSAGFELPKEVFVHGYVTADGQKMSKSIGNVVDPQVMLSRYGADALRYYLMKGISTFEDGDFSEKALRDAINNELVGNLGNFVNRTLSFIYDRLAGEVAGQELGEGKLVMEKVHALAREAAALLDEGQLNQALLRIMEISSVGNKYFQENEPWRLLKEGDSGAVNGILLVCANICRTLGILIWPYMPSASEKLLAYIGQERRELKYATELLHGFSVGKPVILFNKVE